MPLDQNEKPTEKTSAPSFVQQRGELAAEVNERLSDVNADLFALISAMNEKGERVFTFSEEDPKSVLMPGGRATTWHYGIELPSDAGGKIRLSVCVSTTRSRMRTRITRFLKPRGTPLEILISTWPRVQKKGSISVESNLPIKSPTRSNGSRISFPS